MLILLHCDWLLPIMKKTYLLIQLIEIVDITKCAPILSTIASRTLLNEIRVHGGTKTSYLVAMFFAAFVARVITTDASRRMHCVMISIICRSFSTARRRLIVVALDEISISWYGKCSPNSMSVLYNHHSGTDFVIWGIIRVHNNWENIIWHNEFHNGWQL